MVTVSKDLVTLFTREPGTIVKINVIVDCCSFFPLTFVYTARDKYTLGTPSACQARGASFATLAAKILRAIPLLLRLAEAGRPNCYSGLAN